MRRCLEYCLRLSWGRFSDDVRGTSAIEFAILSIPFIFLVLLILQMSVYYLAQSSLDAGTIQAADYLVNLYNGGTTPNFTQSALRSMVYSKSGAMIKDDSTFLVDVKLLFSLASTVVPVSNIIDANTAGSVLALRAQGTVVTFMPGFASLATVRSSALIRRQGT